MNDYLAIAIFLIGALAWVFWPAFATPHSGAHKKRPSERGHRLPAALIARYETTYDRKKN